MWPISWPRTLASSASEFMCVRIPRVTKTGPPGSAKAFTVGSSRTVNVQGRSGRSDFAAMRFPIPST